MRSEPNPGASHTQTHRCTHGEKAGQNESWETARGKTLHDPRQTQLNPLLDSWGVEHGCAFHRSVHCCLCAQTHACPTLPGCRFCFYSQDRPGFWLTGWYVVYKSVLFLISGSSDLTNTGFPAVSGLERSSRRWEAAAQARSLLGDSYLWVSVQQPWSFQTFAQPGYKRQKQHCWNSRFKIGKIFFFIIYFLIYGGSKWACVKFSVAFHFWTNYFLITRNWASNQMAWCIFTSFLVP